MTAEIVERVMRSARYRDVDPALVRRLADEELPRSRSGDEAVKRVKRRLHQAVGAFRGRARSDSLAGVRAAWSGEMSGPVFRAACAAVLASHASSRERVPHLDAFYAGIWERTGVPSSVLDLGCGLGPLALPWMGLPSGSSYRAIDVDGRPLGVVDAFLALIGRSATVEERDLVVDPPREFADVALLLKLVPTLDRQDPRAAARLLGALDVRHAVVSFPRRSLAGRGKGMESTYRRRLDQLLDEVARVAAVEEASVPNELVFVLTMEPARG